MPQDIKAYIVEAKKLKFSDDQIKATLTNAGWPPHEVDAALGEKDTASLLPPPPPVVHTGMWTGFLYILLFIALYVLATSVAGIFHIGVEKTFPNPGSLNWYTLFGYYEDAAIRGLIAAIIVSFPIFSTIWFILAKQIRKNPSIKNIRSRKQLIYFTLVIAFIVLMWQIIGAITGLLNGSLTSNSFGHIMVTIVIAGTIFSYFILEVVHDAKER